MSFGANRFGSSQFGGWRFGSGRFGASTGGLTKAALIDRLKTLGAVSCYLPSEYATLAWAKSNWSTGPAVVNGPIGFLGETMSGVVFGSDAITNGGFNPVSDGVQGHDNGNGTVDGYSAMYASLLSVTDGALKVAGTLAGASAYAEAVVGGGTFYVASAKYNVGTSYNANRRALARTLADVAITDAPASDIPTWQSLSFTFRAPISGAKVGGAAYMPVVGNYFLLDDLSVISIGARHSEQIADSNRPSLRYAGGIYYLDPASGQGLTAYLPDSIGSTVTVIYANPGIGAVVVPGVTVSSQAVWLPYRHSGLVIMPSTVSTEAVAATAAMVDVLARRVVV